ncbi:MAG TPA: tetratricopeptide repeat protein [Pyrinomonadaceae bacterium]|jgi:Tfp pilus assembly protein PilF|nr:tetratricopeptide repeat protein [Pyrinomonadaceae bacterium]
MSEDEDAIADAARLRAVELFRRAYAAQLEENYAEAVELYRRSIETYPTAEAHTFLGWVYSFDGRYDEAIDECLNAIRVDSSFGNPYNDIGSYLVAQGDLWTSVRWFRRALAAPRYESYAFPHFNLGRVYEQRHRPLDAAHHYGLALEERPDFAQAAKALRRVQALLN